MFSAIDLTRENPPVLSQKTYLVLSVCRPTDDLAPVAPPHTQLGSLDFRDPINIVGLSNALALSLTGLESFLRLTPYVIKSRRTS